MEKGSNVFTYVDENGEERISAPVDSHKVVNLNQSKAYRQKLERERQQSLNRGRTWVACYHEPIRAIVKQLSLTEAGAIIKLLPYLRFKSGGRLINEGAPLKQKDIQRILGRGRDATIAIIKRLESFGIIDVEKKGRKNEYRFNADYHSIGTVIDDTSFTKLYQVKTREKIKKLSLNQAGMLYKILPFFHYDNYYLCANPDEQDPKVIEHLSREQLAELIGHKPETVSRMMTALRNAGIIMQQRASKSETYIVHPDVMFRRGKETEYTQVIRKQFAELARRRNLV